MADDTTQRVIARGEPLEAGHALGMQLIGQLLDLSRSDDAEQLAQGLMSASAAMLVVYHGLEDARRMIDGALSAAAATAAQFGSTSQAQH